MKFASRISSIRRIAWKQCRSCSADSLSMWCDSLARKALAGMDPLAARLEHRRHRVLGEPVDLEVGMELAQLVRDRGVALRVAEPDRRGDVERAFAARLAANPAARRRRGLDEVAQQQVDLDRVAHVRAVSGAFEDDELAAGRAPRARCPRRGAGDRVLAPWITSTGHWTRRAAARARSPRRAGPRAASRRASRRRLERPSRRSPRSASSSAAP